MKTCPRTLGKARVICYTPVDKRHRFTGACNHFVGGRLLERMAALAICQYEGDGSFYLFRCDADWNTVSDTWHDTLDDAKDQAEFEYEGINKTWMKGT